MGSGMSERVSFPSSLAFLDAQHEELDLRIRELGKLQSGADGESVASEIRHILKLLKEHTNQEEQAMENHGYFL
jgi:hemerythrin